MAPNDPKRTLSPTTTNVILLGLREGRLNGLVLKLSGLPNVIVADLRKRFFGDEVCGHPRIGKTSLRQFKQPICLLIKPFHDADLKQWALLHFVLGQKGVEIGFRPTTY